ncbi:conserved exported hypothetical protein [Paraburkholderia ribeironis]|uniref:Secreted protein n=1 Tax=Paraburkholderia ribeironis TaxID=1247936 RepID=A0A1N7SGM6_9BURK|nr:hypothetical protein [Paraburkholderia ribeironis]SIT46129.1 conserved exported hypothetical protein [Paraburkholderia ribeironis]
MKVKASGIVAGVLIAIAPLLSCAADLPAPFEGSSTLQADGVVKSVDLAKQSLTVIDMHGGEGSFTVTDARNLAQIRQGGKVHVRMIRNAVIRPTHAVGAQAKLAPSVERDTTQYVAAEVEVVDHASGVLALKRTDGAVFHIRSREPAAVANVTPGMRMAVTFAPQVSVAVTPAQ